MTDLAEQLPDVASLLDTLDAEDYLADPPLGTALFLAARMGQPLLLEGEPGVGKTEAAKALAEAIDTPLIRLQCYEGLTSAEALYEWNYPRQLLAIRLAEAQHETLREADLFGPDYLLARPLLAAIEHPGPRPAVLLIDEVDRGDDEFEAFLFELLAESSVTIPELGTRRAAFPPVVVLTSNRTRDLHDALKRRCLYHWIDYPGATGLPRSSAAGCPGSHAAGRPGRRPASPGCAASTWPSRPGVAEADELDRGAAHARRAGARRASRRADRGRSAQVRRRPADRPARADSAPWSPAMAKPPPDPAPLRADGSATWPRWPRGRRRAAARRAAGRPRPQRAVRERR